jgi:tetratricopeptide (TPR) repeat protein
VADADKPLVRRSRARKVKDELPETPDAVDIAMHAIAIGADQSGIARAVLEKHARLIDIQCKREREELENVRVQRIMRWLILVAIAGAIAAVGAAVYRAINSEALVVEPFEVPPTLSQAGLGGEVMATRVMDKIAAMQEQTLSTRPASTFSTNWGDDIKVAVPDTGATIGDIRRMLRSWFGKETRISGEVVREDNGWTVTGRVSGHTAIVAKGAALEPLVQQVAEGIFHQTQAYRYVVYLNSTNRRPEAMAAARDLAMNGAESERPWGVVAVANSLALPDYGDVETLEPIREAAAAVPDFPMPVSNYGSALDNLGRWEEALKVYRRAASLDAGRVSDQFRGQYLALRDGKADALLGAYGDAAAKMEAASRAGTPVFGADYAQQAALFRYLQHDSRAGDADLRRYAQMLGYTGTKSLSLNPGGSIDAALAPLVTVARIFRADSSADKPMLVASLRDGVPALQQFIRSIPPKAARDFSRQLWPFVARPMIDGGMAAQASALLQGLPDDCYPCVVARARVAGALGQRAMAERLFAQANRIGPSLPFANEARGRMLLAAEDVAGAERAFSQAVATGPRFANAHEGAGEAYAARHDWAAAAGEFGRAAQYAPTWGKLHIRWAAALWNSGRSDESRAKLKAASSMDLSGADRALLSGLEKIAARSAP